MGSVSVQLTDTRLESLIPSGSVVSNTERPLPAGISGPGHAAWLHDGDNQILVSGNTSGNLAVVISGL